MSYESVQRRRLTVAIALTVVLVPALFLLSRDDGDPTTPPVTVIGAPTTATTPEPASDGPAATDVMGTSPVDMLTDPLPNATDEPATIAIPVVPDALIGEATFTRSIALPTGCYAPEVPYNRRITVTNLDNSRTVDCINNVGGTRPPEAIVLHPDAFLQIADLTDAPVPVQINW